MKDKILYHQATARTYLSLSKAMNSSWYLSQAIKEIKAARKLLDIYNELHVESTIFLKLVA